LILFIQHPRDAVEFFKFEEEYGRTYVLPPEVWFRRGGFEAGEIVSFQDYSGKHHQIVFGPTHKIDRGVLTYLMVDHHPQPFVSRLEGKETPAPASYTPEQLTALAEMGEIRAPTMGVVVEVKVKEGDAVKPGDVLLVLEAMKMLNRISSPVSGTVTTVTVKLSQQVAGGDLLVRIKPRAPEKKRESNRTP
jgi:pyruvate carboxylase